MAASAELPTEWPEKVKAALSALLGFFASESDLARFFWLEPLGAGELIVTRHREAMRALIELLSAERPPNQSVPPPSETAEEAVVGGVDSHSSPSGSAAARPSACRSCCPTCWWSWRQYLVGGEAERLAAEAR